MANRSTRSFLDFLPAWWKHKGSLALSVAITLFALFVYFTTFIGQRPTPTFDFVSRLELNSLDTRFRFRGRRRPDPRIIIVDIDQRSQEILGRWPFPRVNFARMLDNLREDGASVVAFDVTFSKPDETLAPLRNFQAQLIAEKKEGKPVDPAVLAAIEELQKRDDYDQQFADAIQRFGRVVLGNYFLYTQADLQGVSQKSLQHYADLISFFPYPQVRATASAGGPAGYVQLIRDFADSDLIPKGAEANDTLFTGALASDRAGSGFFNVMPDPDGVIRRALLALPYGTDPDPSNWDFYASIDVQAVRLFLNLSGQQTVLDYGKGGIAALEFGPKVTVHPDPVGRMMINYRGPSHTYPYVSMADVVNKNFAPGTFKGKLVLVGASATGIGDLRTTPFGGLDFPGVEIHANIIDNILNQDFLYHGGAQVLVDLGMIFLFGIPLGIWLALVQPRWMIAGLLLLVPFTALVYWAFLHGWWLNFIVPSLFTLIPNVCLVALYRVLVEEHEKRRVRGAFQQYVSPEVIRRLLDDPKLVQPRKTAVSVMFSDVRGFTTLSETLDAQELAALLNGYLTEMTKIIFAQQGTLDKYIGDAVMAFWGAPFEQTNHADLAAQAALDMMSRLAELRKQWQERGQPILDIGIGINTGIASVGNMGSELRYGYTAMGDSVNLASRLEGLNKEFATHIILSESAYISMHDTGFLVRELDLIRVKGKLLPVTIYELLGRRSSAGDLVELCEIFTQGHEAYKLRKWAEAEACFEKILARWPNDGPAAVFLERCEEYIAEEPPEDWEGVYVMKHK
ncbi:MAG TPA: adenylate/guanylate cyclase domain-containing protein [Candidatus Limnocylindrales bacterium]|nr:adenylate/guanylate cyclase domain-containing protein [Candidatus Limnocylindrales bacterium]